MEVEIRTEPGRQEPKIVILAGEETEELRRLACELSGLTVTPVRVWREEESRFFPQSAFSRFYTEGKGVAAQTEKDVWEVRLRLYELEDVLDNRKFVRISNSEIINLDRVTAIDLSVTGTIRMTLDGETVCYVSRRYVKKIKETLKLRGRK